MDIKINIPGFPNVCRVCLVEVSESEPATSITNLLPDGASYWTALNGLCSLDPAEEANENASNERFPDYICNSCAKQIQILHAFRLETIANQQFLKAWIAYQYRADANLLKELFRDQKVHGIIRGTLSRLKIFENDDVSLASLIEDPTNFNPNLPIKLEVKVESTEVKDPLLDSLYNLDEDGEQHEDHDTQICEEGEDESSEQITNDLIDRDNTLGSEAPKKRKRKIVRQIIDGVETRPCFVQNCDPIPVGQRDEHIREKHRAYCKLCGMVFISHTQAVHHWAIHKSDADRFLCEICEKPYWREADLKLHRKEFHGVDVANHECPYCGERFNRKVDMLEHREIHTACKFCTKQSKSYRAMLEHARDHHREKLLPCKSCPTAFLSAKELEKHEQVHLDGRAENCIQFPIKNWTAAHCQTCERDLFSPEYLQRHLEKDHPQGPTEKAVKVVHSVKRRSKEELDQLEYKFKCDECPAQFRIKTSLTGHWRKNHSGVKFICEHCGASFKTRATMLTHERYLHTKVTPFACDFCDKRCHTKNDLKIHRRSHTNEKPYKCWHEGCDKAYKTRSAVTKHYRCHTGEKPYKCSYEGCDKSYACSQVLKDHTRKHTLEKPFKCWYCELHFDSTKNRSKHCNRHHAGMPIGRELEKLNQQEGAMENSTEVASTSTNSGRMDAVTVKSEMNLG